MGLSRDVVILNAVVLSWYSLVYIVSLVWYTGRAISDHLQINYVLRQSPIDKAYIVTIPFIY